MGKEAAYYNCPEAPVHVDPTAFGRNFFMADSDSEVDEKEREQILSEATMLKELAANYQHPEVKVDSSDATLFGRNYFNRFDGSEVVDEEDAEERAQILADAAALMKKNASKFSAKPANLKNLQLTINTLRLRSIL